MQIESGTTKWWRNRHLMFLAMFLGFAAYFAYDGFYAWPAANVRWAAQAMGVPPERVKVNEQVNTSALKLLEADLKQKESIPFPELIDKLKARLGEPSLAKEQEHWWVGPAMYVKAAIQDGKAQLVIELSKEHSESSIRGQKWFAAALLVAGLVVLLKLLRVVTTRVVLDDSGLRYNSRHIPWEAMTGLRTDDYQHKGWVYLEYTGGGVTRSFRLDSYHIEKFNEIINAICERKGFNPPITTDSKTGEVEDDSPPVG
ncbi:MAG TPA: PH domain-containing protein [Phycisphaerae bacterium]|jgi:hypothetical protein|nr:PH domain-containing protein [Phycisphaerae bacterium]HOJ55505.1 PH domain-containing protein [Phycisphaerae bacterium]HOL26015.1 PH domain-containing protein [Phycisphaerae bacterium]HPP22535.1 PH domain-containing protein [Phycisphaerae bacterium]HPU33370.1 PH domain-containing protein [Phycisphaerae bacterium]